MKLLVTLVALLAFANARSIEPKALEHNTAYGYLKTYGVPLADRIRKAEEEYQRGEVRIIGGTPSQLGEHPWQAGLINDMVGGGQGVCGGSLINNRRVVTAAHCWFDGRNQAWRTTVVLGSVLIFTGGTRLQSTNVVMHGSWNPNNVRNDVAIIYLPSNVGFSSTIAPIALPSGAELNQNFANWNAVASGFGLTRDNGQIASNQFLSHVSLNVIANSVCSLSFPTIIQSSNICTSGVGNVGTCSGDSGGPLTVWSNNRRVLVGITSFGSALGCETIFPAVFARVTSFMDFINRNT